MVMLTMMMAVLVPGLDLEEQPFLPDVVTQRAAVVADLREVMAEADAAVERLLAERAAAAQAERAAEERRSKEVASYSQASRYGVGEPWASLADCESGDWEDGGRSFAVGSARWDWGAPGVPLPPWGTTRHHGGLQFHPLTWSWVAPMVGLGHIRFAYEATPEQQVTVARRVQELQGWRAWPVCSRKVGLR